jgi:hypothetical protein
MRKERILCQRNRSNALWQPAVLLPGDGTISRWMAGVGAEELISDVSENGGATRRDSAFGDQSEEAGEKLAEVDSRRELGELRKEIRGEVFRVVIQLQGSGGFGEAEMVRTKAEVRLRASEAATLPVGEAIQATRCF